MIKLIYKHLKSQSLYSGLVRNSLLRVILLNLISLFFCYLNIGLILFTYNIYLLIFSIGNLIALIGFTYLYNLSIKDRLTTFSSGFIIDDVSERFLSILSVCYFYILILIEREGIHVVLF